MNYLTIHGRQKYFQTLIGSMGLRLVEEDVKMPRTDGRTLYVPKYPVGVAPGDDAETEYFYLGIHEAEHNAPENVEDLQYLKHIKNRLVQYIHNIIVDHNIEKRAIERGYDGRNAIIGNGAAKWYREMIEDGMAKPSESPEDAKSKAVMCLDNILRADWLPEFRVFDPAAHIPKDAEGYLETLLDAAGLTDEFLNVKTPKENWELTQRVCKLLKIENQENPEEQMQNGHGKPQQGKGEKQEGEQGESQGQGQGEDQGEGEGERGSGGDREVKFSNLLHHDHADEPSYANGSLSIIYDNLGADRGKHTPLPESEHKVYDLQDPNCPFYNEIAYPDETCRNDIQSIVHSSTLSKKVRRLIQVANRNKYRGGKTRGRLKSGSLARLVTGDARVFRNKEVTRTTDIDVTLLVDNSGSMGGRGKFTNAVACAILMSEVLSQLNVNHEIISFTAAGRKPYNLINKSFNKKTSTEELLRQSGYCRQWMASNADGEHILFAFKRLMAQRGKRKLMLVFSDGQPAGISGIAEYTQDILREIQDKSPVEVYGIGIKSDAVEHFYDNCAVIHDANQLEAALFEVIETKLI